MRLHLELQFTICERAFWNDYFSILFRTRVGKNVNRRTILSQYGRVVIGYDHDPNITLWIRYFYRYLYRIDGNPNLVLNGGVVGLAGAHCLASLVNHSDKRPNCEFVVVDGVTSHNLLNPDGSRFEGVSMVMYLVALRDIYPHEQLLANYGPGTANIWGHAALPF